MKVDRGSLEIRPDLEKTLEAAGFSSIKEVLGSQISISWEDEPNYIRLFATVTAFELSDEGEEGGSCMTLWISAPEALYYNGKEHSHRVFRLQFHGDVEWVLYTESNSIDVEVGLL